MALQLGPEWKVTRSELSPVDHTLRIWLDFREGHRFPCPECGCPSPAHDTVEKRWRQMNFWQQKTELVARVPRVDSPEHGVRLAEVPWARPGSGFTLMMEAVILMLAQEMSFPSWPRCLRSRTPGCGESWSTTWKRPNGRRTGASSSGSWCHSAVGSRGSTVTSPERVERLRRQAGRRLGRPHWQVQRFRYAIDRPSKACDGNRDLSHPEIRSEPPFWPPPR